jgi:hypothetical protein
MIKNHILIAFTLVVIVGIALLAGGASVNAQAQTYDPVTGAPITDDNQTNDTSALTGTTTDGTAGTDGTSTTTSVTPGVPNTGAGGTAQTNLLVLLTSAAVAVAGASYMLRGSVRVR